MIIATIGRPQIQKALCSIQAQDHPPAQVLVCVDGSDRRKARVERTLGSFPLRNRVMPNDRTPGAAGAWNTALDRLAREAADPGAVMVSFLDDDDWWETDHLRAVGAAFERGAEVTATTIVRHDTASPDGTVIEPPQAIVHGAFLRGNPGIQGSNLSVQLSVILEAGMFDESLPSCTDRDLCIRLADLGARYEGIRTGRIHHDACRRGRLSTPGSRAKRQGLDTFFAKHAWRMTLAETEACLARGKALFEWTPEAAPEVTPEAKRVAQTTERMHWIVATIVDCEVPERALPFVDDLARLAAHPRIAALAPVLLPNGPAAGFEHILAYARARKLHVRVISPDEQRDIGRQLGLHAEELDGKKSIAAARSVLQRVAHEVARDVAAPVVWVADDDLRLPPDLDLLIDDVARARAAGLDAAIGLVAGAPPVPAATTLRTQLVDLVSFLRGAAIRDARDAAPDAARYNARWKLDRRDYYYDLVRRQTDRLETPFLPTSQAADLGTMVAEMVRRAPRMLAGEQIFRPVQPAGGDPLAALSGVKEGDAAQAHATTSLVRGGNTFVFDIDLLRDVPNLSPRVAGRRLRRSDTLWALLARFHLRRAIHMLPIVVLHDRSHEPIVGFEPDKLFDDVLGYAFSRAFEEHLRWRHTPGAPLRFTEGERERIQKRAHKLARERTAELRLSCFRIRGLGRALDHLLDVGPRPCGLDEPGEATLRALALTLRRDLSDAAFRELGNRIQSASTTGGFADYLDAISANLRLGAARRCCEERLDLRVDEVLGAGNEGVILRSGDRVVKVLDRWSEGERGEHLASLRALAERPAPGALPAVLAVHAEEEPVLLEMEWVASEPYTGENGPQIVALLRALREAGWAHSNVHPRNLRVTRDGVRIIDVGRSLMPFSLEAEIHVARRAFLSLRHAGHPDLTGLMRRSIDDASLPELRGFECLLQAVRGRDPKVHLDETVASAAARRCPGSVLDFGGGKPRPFRRRFGHGSFTAFDPDPALPERWRREAPEVPFLGQAELARLLEANTRFDVVLCSLVLCSLDDRAMVETLGCLRRLVHDEGAVLVAVCDPRAVQVEHTARHTRLLPREARYESSFSYMKQVLGAGARVEHHRPLSAYRRAFFDAGFEGTAEHTVSGVDTDRFEPALEFVLFELHPRGEAPHEERPEPVPARSPRGAAAALPAKDALAGLTVISYHRVAGAGHRDPAIALHRARGMVVSPEVLACHMSALGRLFQPVRMQDVHDAAMGRTSLPDRAAWITFDDGYRDIAADVLPVLERERLPATLFVRAPCDDGLPSWAPLDLYYQVLARARVHDPLALLPQGEERERLLGAAHLEQMRLVLDIAARHGVDLAGLRRGDLYLSAHELGELRSSLFSIGAHGTEHVRWTTLDDEALRAAAQASADWLDRRHPGAPLCVAYPDAAVDARVTTAAARAGFGLGVILEARAPSGVARRLVMQRRIARDDEAWVEALASEVDKR